MPDVAPTTSAIPSDLATMQATLDALLTVLHAGPRTRYRALLVTSLQEARHWLQDAIAEETRVP